MKTFAIGRCIHPKGIIKDGRQIESQSMTPYMTRIPAYLLIDLVFLFSWPLRAYLFFGRDGREKKRE